MRKSEHVSRLTYTIADGLAAAAEAGLAYVVRFEAGWIAIEGRTDVLPQRYLEALPVTVAVLLLATALAGGYRPRALRRPRSVGLAVRSAALGGALLAALALGYRDAFQYSRLALVFIAIGYVPAMIATRTLALAVLRRLVAAGALASRAALAGAPERMAAVLAALCREPWPATRVVHTLAAPSARSGGAPDDLPGPLPDGDALVALVADGQVQEVIVAARAEDAAWTRRLLRRLEETPADVRLVPDLADETLVNPDAVVIGGVPILSLRERPLYGTRALAKRIVDITFAALLLAVTAPLLAVLAVLVRTTSPGPALYRQRRTGLDGRVFEMLKLRTMQSGAEEGSGPVFARRGDVRVTPLGRFLRRFSLDELPQLWNVLRGDMSLVGPRPERPELLEELRRRHPGYMLRLSVKAGMTGWAQVHGLRGGTPFDERLRMDLEYIDAWSLWLDLEILVRTAAHVLRGENAY